MMIHLRGYSCIICKCVGTKQRVTSQINHHISISWKRECQSVIRICQAFQNAPEIVCEPQQMIISML